ncbi:hypothetical protein IAT38_005671 [Cryptococcus sp. DSM 104549]
MPSVTLLALGILPIALLLVPLWVEPYALWDPSVLNQRDGHHEGRATKWCNMGWWENTDVFPDAAEALGKKLLDFAKEGGYAGGGYVLDIGHGAGDSLVLHLSQPDPPRHLDALTSLSRDTKSARSIVASEHPSTTTDVEFFTFSAEFKPGKDVGHPLDPMRGYLGEKSSRKDWEEEDDEEGNEVETGSEAVAKETGGAPPYDLVYLLDSLYHYRPSRLAFLNTLRPVLRPTSVVAYTDILPPPSLPAWKARLVSYLFSVPYPNLQPAVTLEEYKASLKSAGWEDVVVEDWTEGVLPGFARNLEARGGAWKLFGGVIGRAMQEGWRFVGVRARMGGVDLGADVA